MRLRRLSCGQDHHLPALHLPALALVLDYRCRRLLAGLLLLPSQFLPLERQSLPM
jgi:hypothetical protein